MEYFTLKEHSSERSHSVTQCFTIWMCVNGDSTDHHMQRDKLWKSIYPTIDLSRLRRKVECGILLQFIRNEPFLEPLRLTIELISKDISMDHNNIPDDTADN